MNTGLPALILLVLAAALFISSPAAARSKPGRAKIPAQNANPAFQPAQECSKCHSSIFRTWKQSMHAAAYENPVFQTAYRKTWLEEGSEAARSCLPCHAPAAAATGDHAAAQPISREGVSCNVCHGGATVDIHAEPDNRSDPQRGGVKHPTPSAIKTGAPGSTAHDGNFTRVRPCAGCHEFENRHKMRIGATHSEWSASPAAAAGETCQKCHMPSVAGRTANKDGREGMHDHSLVTTLQTMRGAVTAEITEVTLSGGTMTASIALHNVKAGHYVPTGSSSRSLVLEVRLMDAAGNILETQNRIYCRTLADGNGKGISSYGDAFLHATTVTSDNRLAPGETRTETVRFTALPRENTKIEVELHLLATPYVAQRADMKIPLSSADGH